MIYLINCQNYSISTNFESKKLL